MGLGLQERRELRSLRHENSKLKQVIADLTLDRHISRRSFEKSRKSLAHVALAITQDALRQRLRELAAVRVRFCYRRLTVLLRREGWRVNAKRIYRLYGDEGLTVRTKPRKRLASRRRVPMPVAMRPNERRSMDFVSARTTDGRSFRTLTVLDLYTRESLALLANRSLTGVKVASTLSRVLQRRAAPNAITVVGDATAISHPSATTPSNCSTYRSPRPTARPAARASPGSAGIKVVMVEGLLAE